MTHAALFAESEPGFTHHDPLEDTESTPAFHEYLLRRECFTHHDPLEDTESPQGRGDLQGGDRFTHHDPLEDTESATQVCAAELCKVSPITIRLRILKVTSHEISIRDNL